MSSQQYKGPIHLTKEMYDTLMSTGSVVDEHGVTHTYEDGHEYVTDEIDYVDLTSSQDVEGVKTFLDGIKIGADTTKLTGVENSAPASGSTKAITSGVVYSALSGKAPTSHASSSSTYGLGTTSNYGHVKLATGDMNNATGSDGVACGKNHTHGQYMPFGQTLMPTNPFGGKSLYINSIDNAFASADKKYYVTITKHTVSSGGVTYPYIDTSKAVTDDDYFVDGPIVSTLTSSAHDLFNGDYEGGMACSNGQYLKIRIMFGSNTSPSGTTAYFPGYPYGTYYLSYYYTSVPTKASQYRVYNKFSSHTVGWKVYDFSAFNSSLGNTNLIEHRDDAGNYQRSCVEFIVFGGTNGTSLTEIDYKLSRPNLSRDGSTVTKYGNQSLYHQFTWYNNHSETAKITPEGYIYGTTLYEGGTSLANKYITSNSDQTGLTGNKTTSGAWTFTHGDQNTIVVSNGDNRKLHIGASGPYATPSIKLADTNTISYTYTSVLSNAELDFYKYNSDNSHFVMASLSLANVDVSSTDTSYLLKLPAKAGTLATTTDIDAAKATSNSLLVSTASWTLDSTSGYYYKVTSVAVSGNDLVIVGPYSITDKLKLDGWDLFTDVSGGYLRLWLNTSPDSTFQIKYYIIKGQ